MINRLLCCFVEDMSLYYFGCCCSWKHILFHTHIFTIIILSEDDIVIPLIVNEICVYRYHTYHIPNILFVGSDFEFELFRNFLYYMKRMFSLILNIFAVVYLKTDTNFLIFAAPCHISPATTWRFRFSTKIRPCSRHGLLNAKFTNITII